MWGLNKIADILQTIFSNAFLERLSVPQGPIYKKPSSLAVMAWQQTDDNPLPELMMTQFANTIWVRSRMCGCLVTWFCYHLIAKPGNKTAAVPWPDPYHQEHNSDLEYIRVSSHEPSQNSLTFPWPFCGFPWPWDILSAFHYCLNTNFASNLTNHSPKVAIRK